MTGVIGYRTGASASQRRALFGTRDGCVMGPGAVGALLLVMVGGVVDGRGCDGGGDDDLGCGDGGGTLDAEGGRGLGGRAGAGCAPGFLGGQFTLGG